MYLNETDEYKDELALLIKEFLKQRIKGMQNSQGVYITQAFPKLLYVLEEDNINENSKYFDLTKLAAECTAKRMVPDYISEKIMLQEKYGIDNITGKVVAGYENVYKANLANFGFSEKEIEDNLNTDTGETLVDSPALRLKNFKAFACMGKRTL